MPLAEPAATNIDAEFRRHRIRVMLAITLGYGFIYTCRLGLSIVKKPVIDSASSSTASCRTTSAQESFSPRRYSLLQS
jgi:sugar phosphate permease